MYDSLHGLLHAFRFAVDIDGTQIDFKSVKGIKLAAAFEPLQVGGMNDGPVLLPMPVKEQGKITFERGKYISPSTSLPKPGELISNVAVTVYDSDFTASATYTFESPAVESIELGSLDALSSEVLVETLTIAFRRLQEM